MRKILFVFLIVLVSVAWAAAQQGANGPGSMSGQSSQSGADSQSSPGGRAVGPAGQSTSPGAPSDKQATPPSTSASGADQGVVGSSKVIEGCLGGTSPNFTVTDQSGTKYKLDIPKDADSSPLNAHVGESVKVKGVVTGEKATASTSGGAATASVTPTIQVEQMGRGTGTCPGGASSKPATK